MAAGVQLNSNIRCIEIFLLPLLADLNIVE